MNAATFRFAFISLLAAVLPATAAIRYVAAAGTNPVPPYTSWATAAVVIQDAVAAAEAGDTVLVTNGVYATGGRAVSGTMTNRVAVDKPVTLLSVNGPEHTVIRGFQVPGTTNGAGAIRCVYLVDGAGISGFTLTNGATTLGGSGGGLYCTSTNAWASNCVIVANAASASGGGTCGGLILDCRVTGNAATDGGGSCRGELRRCLLANNSATNLGGGSYLGVLRSCTVSGNRANLGGGCYAFFYSLYSCTITRNAAQSGGGVHGGNTHNSIIYFNRAEDGSDNLAGIFYVYDCWVQWGATGDPRLASASHLGADSPCRGAGNAQYVSGTDIDGAPWADPPSIGCDEYGVGALTGRLSVDVDVPQGPVASGHTLRFEADIFGPATSNKWDFGDGTMAYNTIVVSHAWSEPGEHEVVVRAYNDDWPGGVAATAVVQVVEEVHYVSADSTNPAAPYLSWETAAATIQDAVDVAVLPGALVLVTNGIYATGGRVFDGALTNRVMLDRPVHLRSVNGPDVTVIQGYQIPGSTNGDAAVRCAYLTDGARLSGFTLTGGATRAGSGTVDRFGGGVYCQSTNAVVSGCILVGNAADYKGGGACQGLLQDCILRGNAAANGGGASSAVLRRCTLIENLAPQWGGGAHFCTLLSCFVTGNQAGTGGGAYESELYNCTVTRNTAISTGGTRGGLLMNSIVYFNAGASGSDNAILAYQAENCCTAPRLTIGDGNIDADPLLEGPRLRADSPCINAGRNAYAVGPVDLDGNPRVKGGTVDIGAYEFQTPQSTISYAWMQQHDLPTDGSADFLDPDGDRATTWQEWIAWTDPTNAQSVLKLVSPAQAGDTIAWQSVLNQTYFVERATHLAAPFVVIESSIVGQDGATGYTDPDPSGEGARFYRVGVPGTP